MAAQADKDEERGGDEPEALNKGEGEGEGDAGPDEAATAAKGEDHSEERAKAKKRSGKARGKSKPKGDTSADVPRKDEATKDAPAGAAAGRDLRYLLGHAVIWVGVLGAVAYLMAKGR
jgi:hypothetical protein